MMKKYDQNDQEKTKQISQLDDRIIKYVMKETR
jgi:hypothetical protein